MHHGQAPSLDLERITERLARAGCDDSESLFVALAVLATIGSPLRDADVAWIASAAKRIGDPDLLLETAGVVFAFNTINRIADARRVRLEYRFLRELLPIRGWIERGLASLTGLAYDLSYKHRTRRSSAELLERVAVMFDRLGVSVVPDVFNWLSQSPVVLEGILRSLILMPSSTTQFALKVLQNGLHLSQQFWSIGKQAAFGFRVLFRCYRPAADAVMNPGSRNT